MNLRTLSYALAAGIASFLVVGIAVTAAAERWIEFSVFLCLPAGLLAGAVAAVAVSLGLDEGAPAERRRLALAFGLFGAGFLATLVVLAVAGQGLVTATVAGAAVGLVAGVVGYRRGTTARSSPRVRPEDTRPLRRPRAVRRRHRRRRRPPSRGRPARRSTAPAA